MIGTMLGNRYELLEKIGEGGMSIVYKAKCHLLNRYVAVKILKDEFASDKEFVGKFKAEASAAASLSNHNIVNIFDVGSQGNVNYIVMEYIKGRTLKEVVREKGKLGWMEAVQVSLQISKALECAHKNNIIHRDIKPHNILVTEENIVKVTDFGIAKASNSVTITNTSKIMGSAHYFSPEQAKGSYVDFRTDIYSLGIVMYELVTGRVPFDAQSPVSVALKHIQEPIVPPKLLNEYMPDSLNKLILKAVEKEPIKRYQTIKELIEDLKKVENNETLNIYPTFDDGMTRAMDPVAVNEKIKSTKNNEDDYYEPKSGLDPKKKKILFGVAIAILVIAVGLVSGYFYNKISGNSGEPEVPQIIGLKSEDAKKLVEAKKLKFVVYGKEKSEKPEGTVLRCFPTEGTKVKVNSDVRVSVSGGQSATTVPNLKEVDLESAKGMIKNAGLKLGKIEHKNSDSVPKDSVISQNPEPDSDATSDTIVDLVVSNGSDSSSTLVPDLSNRTLESASAALSNSKLKLGEKKSVNTSDESLDGKVLNQSIEANQKVREGTVINVTYYKYKVQIEQP